MPVRKNCFHYRDVKGKYRAGCGCGLECSDDCKYYSKKVVCSGGLVIRADDWSKEYCRECARTCAGCLEKSVEYGFVPREAVAHLLRY